MASEVGPEHYRQRIEALRRMAAKSKYPEEKKLFEQLADFYERQLSLLGKH